MSESGQDRPLEGIRVVEIGTWVALPGGCAILADWGAEVLKIEHPAGGDPARGWRWAPTPPPGGSRGGGGGGCGRGGGGVAAAWSGPRSSTPASGRLRSTR